MTSRVKGWRGLTRRAKRPDEGRDQSRATPVKHHGYTHKTGAGNPLIFYAAPVPSGSGTQWTCRRSTDQAYHEQEGHNRTLCGMGRKHELNPSVIVSALGRHDGQWQNS